MYNYKHDDNDDDWCLLYLYIYNDDNEKWIIYGNLFLWLFVVGSIVVRISFSCFCGDDDDKDDFPNVHDDNDDDDDGIRCFLFVVHSLSFFVIQVIVVSMFHCFGHFCGVRCSSNVVLLMDVTMSMLLLLYYCLSSILLSSRIAYLQKDRSLKKVHTEPRTGTCTCESTRVLYRFYLPCTLLKVCRSLHITVLFTSCVNVRIISTPNRLTSSSTVFQGSK